MAGRCHGGTNFTVLADGAILIGVPQVATTGPSEALIDVWDSPDEDYWVLVKATNLDGSGGGSAGPAGPAGAQGPQGKQGDAGPAGATGADADCVACADVASGAVDLACLVLGENIPTSYAETQAAALVIVNTLLISTNICEPDCDIGSEINAAIDVKLNP